MKFSYLYKVIYAEWYRAKQENFVGKMNQAMLEQTDQIYASPILRLEKTKTYAWKQIGSEPFPSQQLAFCFIPYVPSKIICTFL